MEGDGPNFSIVCSKYRRVASGNSALVGGFGLQAKLQTGWPGWFVVKLVCWLGLSALAGIGYKRRGAAGTLAIVAVALVATAVVMVYTKPF